MYMCSLHVGDMWQGAHYMLGKCVMGNAVIVKSASVMPDLKLYRLMGAGVATLQEWKLWTLFSGILPVNCRNFLQKLDLLERFQM